MNILYVENSDVLSAPIVFYLHSQGHAVFPAFNVSDANSLLKSEKIDCIIVGHPNSEGLPEEYFAGLDKDLRWFWAGWAWYKTIDSEEMRKIVIFYGSYVASIKEAEKWEGIRLVPLFGRKSGVEKLLKHLKEIEEAM